MTSTSRTRVLTEPVPRRFGRLTLLVAGVLCAGFANLFTAAAASSPSPTPPPACAGDLFPFAGAPSRSPSPVASPLPAPASTVGGPRLARPGLQTDLAAGTAAPPAVRATAWLVADLTSGAVLASCNAHVPLAPASTLKILTAVALIHRVDPAALYTARPQDAAIDGTKAGLVPGSRYTAGNLWHGLLMSSANDCASALAELDGGLPVAVSDMTAAARRLGAADTVVANTSGLDAPGQVSSAYDLAVLGRAALADPDITAYLRERDYPFPASGTAIAGGSGRTAYQIQNHNRLLYNYEGATGVKNGYTVAAGGSFVGSAARGGRSYVVTILRADTNTWRAAAALLDWAFADGPRATPVGALPGPSDALPASPTTGPSAAQEGSGTVRTGAGAVAGRVAAPATPAPGAGDALGAAGGRGYAVGLAGAALLLGGGWYLVRRRRLRPGPVRSARGPRRAA